MQVETQPQTTLHVKQTPLLLIHYKAYHSLEQTISHIDALLEQQKASNINFYLALPLTFLQPLSEHFANQNIMIGAEHMLSVNETQFTASIAAKLLKNAGAKFVLIGSYDERKNFGTDDVELHKKVQHAFSEDLHPILCITDTEEEFQDGLSKTVLSKQLKALVDDLTSEQRVDLRLLYDAAWISRGTWTQTDEALQKAYQNFKDVILEIFPSETIAGLKIMYAVPTYSMDLTQVISALPAAGYSLGTLIATSIGHISPLPQFECKAEVEETIDHPPTLPTIEEHEPNIPEKDEEIAIPFPEATDIKLEDDHPTIWTEENIPTPENAFLSLELKEEMKEAIHEIEESQIEKTKQNETKTAPVNKDQTENPEAPPQPPKKPRKTKINPTISPPPDAISDQESNQNL